MNIERLRERWFEVVQGHSDGIETLNRQIDEWQAANPPPPLPEH